MDAEIQHFGEGRYSRKEMANVAPTLENDHTVLETFIYLNLSVMRHISLHSSLNACHHERFIIHC